MNSLKSPDIGEIVDPDRVVIINLNYSADIFRNVFSKMEFIMAWEYLESQLNKYSIPVLYTNLENTTENDGTLAAYLGKKHSVRAAHTAPVSPLDGKFIEKFTKYMPENREDVMTVPHEDIFLESGVEEWIRQSGRDTVLFTGFFTERDVYISAFEAIMRKYYSVIISDATSTYSERIFFTSLDLISQTVEVIDTRDLEKIW